MVVLTPDKTIVTLPTQCQNSPYYRILMYKCSLWKPLAKGNYTIAYRSRLICPGTHCMEPNFAQDIKYTIIAK